MALPVEPNPDQEAAIRRAAVVFAFWIAGLALGSVRAAEHDAAGVALGLTADERSALDAYAGASQRFSFMDQRAGNWVFGRFVAAAVGRDGDWAVAAPAAAWAIHAIRAADEAAA